ncbi:MAG TPA: RiPP maturation radical SAM C-methyltransferase, partial [Acidimicrobiales bacterium]|nr:RiPP maturation radical SAM C-methyltransferase [Acidimicrobiales bacterium]
VPSRARPVAADATPPMTAAPRVLLVSMPFGALERPSLGLGLLAARLAGDGVDCDTRYLGFTFAEFAGVAEYLWVAGGLPYTAFAGDWAFTASLYGPRPDADASYVDEVLRGEWGLDDDAVRRLLRLRAYCEPFLDHCLGAVPWARYGVVGFTSTFEQNIASLALARRVKHAHPGVTVVFGGANWEGSMGEELHRRFPFVDVVCSGEADESFPALVGALAAGRRDLGAIPGLVWRDGAATRVNGPARPVEDLDALPVPDFDPYFRELEASPAGGSLAPSLLVETARGCWWGARSHCTFCGLNGGAMGFRSKSAGRALAEVRALAERHGIGRVNVTDNILDMRYFRTLLPMLAGEGLGVRLFYEVKANLTHAQVRQLALAGVEEVQPGIESMSDHVLALMRKGTTALRNLQLLKWCREFGIRADWNVLYGFPGETAGDYRDMVALLEPATFLDPPTAYGPIRLDRFSPYHDDPAAFGMVAVRPMRPYRHLYPFPPASLDRIAYYFEFDYGDGREADAYAAPAIELVRRWMAEGRRGELWAFTGPGGDVVVDDRRPGSECTTRLSGWRAAVFSACDRAQPLADVAGLAAGLGVGAAELAGFLGTCVRRRLMLVRGGSCLALPVHRPARLDAAARPRRLRAIPVAAAGPAR